MYVLILFAVAAAWLFYGVFLWWRDASLAKRGITLSARVLSHETSDGSVFYPVLGYTYQNTYYEKRYHVGDKKKYPCGERLDIKILPEKPEKPELAGATNRRTYLFSIAIGIVSFLLGIWLYFR
ncbi:MAG: DUF3592 domain-containing protein [Ruthenibacterium sp.]